MLAPRNEARLEGQLVEAQVLGFYELDIHTVKAKSCLIL
jgi:hypothetical protein